jgi:hypothetical protein
VTPAEMNELERNARSAEVLRLIAYARRLEALLPEAWNAGCDLQERERSRWLADALARAREGSK